MQVSPDKAAGRSITLHKVAGLLANCHGLPEAEVRAGLEKLYGSLIGQNTALFTDLVKSNKKVLGSLLRLGPELSSAMLHSSNISYNTFEHFKRCMEQATGIKMFACKSLIHKHDQQAIKWVTRENFEVTKMELFHTTSSPAPTPRAIIRARDIAARIRQLFENTMAKQKGLGTRNPRHVLYGGRMLVLLESDKGGFSMKYGLRVGPNTLHVIGVFEAADNRSNLLSFTGPWVEQMIELMENGLAVQLEPDEVEDRLEEEGDEEPDWFESAVVEDLRHLLPAVVAELAPAEVEEDRQRGRLGVVLVTDQEVESILELEEFMAEPGLANLNPEEHEVGDEEGEVVEGEDAMGDAEGAKGGGEGAGGEREVIMPVDIVHVTDMAGAFVMSGLSGASGRESSPFTHMTREHLGTCATAGRVHNWEQEGCVYPPRTPQTLHRNAVACSQDTRNNGDMAKNAKFHHSSKATPIIPFKADTTDMLGVYAPFLLHTDLGIAGKWWPDHAETVCRVMDKNASEEELLNLTDVWEDKSSEEQGAATPILNERQKQKAELTAAAREKEEITDKLEWERQVMMKEDRYRQYLVAATKGEEGREELLSLSKEDGNSYKQKKFDSKARRDLSCFPHCLLSGEIVNCRLLYLRLKHIPLSPSLDYK